MKKDHTHQLVFRLVDGKPVRVCQVCGAQQVIPIAGKVDAKTGNISFKKTSQKN